MNMVVLVQMISCPISSVVGCLEVWEVVVERLVREEKILCTLLSKALCAVCSFSF